MAYGLRALSDAEYRRFQTLVHRESGIHLSDAKRALLVGLLARRLRGIGIDSFFEYYERVAQDEAERVQMIDAICTNETHFFREPKQFEFLAAQVYPAWKAAAAAGRRARHVRVWTAACSTGEEPYSVAMSLLTHFPTREGWSIEIVASDLSTRVLARAQEAVWPIDKAAEIPEALRRRFMLRGVGTQAGKMRAGDEIRRLVSFTRLNLNAPSYPVRGRFDLVFCRNVLIYFQPDSKKAVVERLLGTLAPEGILFLGHSETLNGLSSRVRSVGPTAYRLREGGGVGL